MDLSGQQRFREAEAAREGRSNPGSLGRALLAHAWAALASARAESADIHLRSGTLLRGVLALRIDGQLAEAGTRRGEWTHAFPLEEVVMVAVNPRGRPASDA